MDASQVLPNLSSWALPRMLPLSPNIFRADATMATVMLFTTGKLLT